jgi:hypothetical protein
MMPESAVERGGIAQTVAVRRSGPCDDAAMSATFRLDDVARATDLRPTRPLTEALGEALAIGGDPALAVIDHGPTHPLLGAVHVAFAEHRPLVLSPDAVWLTIAQGVAHHVRLHAEALRPRLVRHAGTKELCVDHDGPLPTDPAGWGAIVSAFRDCLAGEVGDGRARLFECDFSTSTDVERVAGRIALMDVYNRYYEYKLNCVCGIPEVTLLGTADDWKKIRARVDVVAELDLEFWTRSLAPIADEFVRAAEGAPDLAFWYRIYKPRDVYGGDLITGWIARLYPYLIVRGREDCPNPLLALPLDEPRRDDSDRDWLDELHNPPPEIGIFSENVPAGCCSARIHVVDTTSGERRDLALHGGVVAVAQDAEGRLAPTCGWALRESTPAIADLADGTF